MYLIFANCVLVLCLQAATGTKQSIEVDKHSAFDFLGRKTRIVRGIHEECYGESCVIEEVKEKIGKNERGYEYYYTYTCNKFAKNCKVLCEYRPHCSFGIWGGWIGKVPTLKPPVLGICLAQRRYRQYRFGLQKIYKRWNCNGLTTECPRQPSEKRNYCVCKSVTCQINGWSAWSGFVSEGDCATQTRKRTYTSAASNVHQIQNCYGIQSNCPRPVIDVRKQCSCRKAVCEEEAWSNWVGSGANGTCYDQIRKKPYHMTYTQEVLQMEKCPDLLKSCPVPQTEKRSKCSCAYFECDLGEWSEWKPKQLEHGKCNQRQKRKRSYSNKIAHQDHIGACPSLPQKCPADVVETKENCECSYRDTCDVGEWSKWSNPETEEGCNAQARHKEYKSPLKHVQRENCNGLNTNCVVEPMEARTMCKCKYVECSEEAWSRWTGPTMLTDNCVVQSRSKVFTASVKYANRLDDCSGLVTSCPMDKKEERTMCKCGTVKCSVGEWGDWQGDIPTEGCTVQTRIKPVTSSRDTIEQANNCKGVDAGCPVPPKETRNRCRCAYREDCSLKSWGNWSGLVPETGCAIQVRSREYNNSLIHVEQERCDGLLTCPIIKDDVRTKCNCNQVQCRWTEWLRESFDAETNCVTEARVKNISAGFKTVQQFDNCNGVRTSCRANSTIERKKDCQSGGDHVIITEKPPTTLPPVPVPTKEPVPATHVYVGCYYDFQKHPRVIPLMLANLRSTIDWHRPDKTVQACAELAKKARYKYFAIQFYAECWSGPEAEKTYSRDGPSADGCWSGLGKPENNAVYRLQDMPACSGELQYSATVSSGEVTELSWCSKNEDQWMKLTFNGDIKRIIGIGTQGVRKDSWVTLYTLAFSEEGEEFTPYKEKGITKILAGNTDRFTLELHWLDAPMETRGIMIRPRTWTSAHYCMKVRLYGCAV